MLLVECTAANNKHKVLNGMELLSLTPICGLCIYNVRAPLVCLYIHIVCISASYKLSCMFDIVAICSRCLVNFMNFFP